jgi:hypothetical protein
MTRVITAGFALILLASTCLAQQQSGDVVVNGNFVSGDDENTALSGIACAEPAAGTPRTCLVALDEGLAAQWATLSLDAPATLTVGNPIALFDGSADTAELQAQIPATSCRNGPGAFNENDSEGVAFLDNQFFVAGSHGCGRNRHKFKASQFIDVRIPLQGAAGTPSATARLNRVLWRLPFLASSYGKDLDDGKGLSIEGIAAAGDRLYFGLRSPAPNDEAAILSVDANAMFSESDPLAEKMYSADLGGLGVRDLARLDGDPARFLALGGPTKGEGGAFAIFLVTLGTDDSPTLVSRLADLSMTGEEKAEGMTVVKQEGGKVTVLVLHDGVANGHPVLHDLQLP